MSEFRIVQHATFPPTRCLTCGRHEGPFIETNVDLPDHGHVWLCVGDDERPGCVVQMARLGGYIGPTDADALQMEIADLELTNAALRDEMLQMSNKKTITIEQARTLLH